MHILNVRDDLDVIKEALAECKNENKCRLLMVIVSHKKDRRRDTFIYLII